MCVCDTFFHMLVPKRLVPSGEHIISNTSRSRQRRL